MYMYKHLTLVVFFRSMTKAERILNTLFTDFNGNFIAAISNLLINQQSNKTRVQYKIETTLTTSLDSCYYSVPVDKINGIASQIHNKESI